MKTRFKNGLLEKWINKPPTVVSVLVIAIIALTICIPIMIAVLKF